MPNLLDTPKRGGIYPGIFLILFTLIIGVLSLVCFRQNQELKASRKMQRELEVSRTIDQQIAGLRVPYEALLWDGGDFREVASYRFRKCQELNMATITPYEAVIQDTPNEWPVMKETDCWNASFENHWLNHYVHSCNALEGWLTFTGAKAQEPLKMFIIEKRLPVLRMHVGRALKSKNEHIALASCSLWLSVLPPTDDVRARLAELIAAPKHRAGDREVSSRQTLEAAALIELYKLQIAFPEAMKKEPEYQRYLQHRLMR